MPNGFWSWSLSVSRRTAVAMICRRIHHGCSTSFFWWDLILLTRLRCLLLEGCFWFGHTDLAWRLTVWTFWTGSRFETDGLNLEAESDPRLHNLKSDSTQVFAGPRKTFVFESFLRKRQIARAEDSVEPIWIRPGSFPVLTPTSMISFIKRLSTPLFFSKWSNICVTRGIPSSSFLSPQC